MPRQLENETAVLAAVRRLIEAGLEGHDVATAMASIVSETSRLSLSNLDEWERKLRTELWAAEGSRSTVGWKLWKGPVQFNPWLDLCSGNGFTREKIMRTLSEGAPNGFFFSLALRRLNDWVSQVRSAAREQLPELARRSDPRHVADALWHTLPHCSSWGRLDKSETQVLADLISIDRVASTLKSMIIRATAGPATVVLAQAARSSALDHSLGEIAAIGVQPSVRARAYRCLLERQVVWVVGRKWTWTDVRWCKGRFEPVLAQRPISVGEPFMLVLERALRDRSALVRRVGADLMIKHLSEVGTDAAILAQRLADDPCESVAERGRFLLARIGGKGLVTRGAS